MIPSFSRALLLLLLLLHLHLPQVTAWGDLTNKRVIKDSVNFNDIYHVAVAPNGKSVYACARHADTVMQWDRNTTNGDLSNRKVYTDTKHLDGASCVVVSPDNKHVYVVSYNSQSICTWTHNFETNDLDNRVCKFSTHLYGAETVVVSPDGKNVYATSYVQKAIIIWTRNVETGALTNEVEIRSELQMSGARGLVVSPKGDFVYISCTLAHTLVYWRRNLQDGSLTHMTYLNDRKVCVCVFFVGFLCVVLCSLVVLFRSFFQSTSHAEVILTQMESLPFFFLIFFTSNLQTFFVRSFFLFSPSHFLLPCAHIFVVVGITIYRNWKGSAILPSPLTTRTCTSCQKVCTPLSGTTFNQECSHLLLILFKLSTPHVSSPRLPLSSLPREATFTLLRRSVVQ